MINKDTPELTFSTRSEFREWLINNAEESGGIWLVFGKTKALTTLFANDALEEALCFGWIDGQMRSVDETRYLKYFARRRGKSPWSDKNKKTIGSLREKNMMTESGEKAVKAAMANGTWDAPERAPITDEQIDAFAEKLTGISPAHENFLKMPRSVRATYTGGFLSYKSEEARQRNFTRIVERLNNNLRPM